jgi:hypothetical protein
MKNATLHHREKDPVLTLYAHYFLAGELMLKNHRRLNQKWSQHGRLSQNERGQLSIYFCTWLGFLGVTAEGFKNLAIRKLVQDARPPEFVELVPSADELGKLLNKHDDALRKFRNDVFHLRDNTDQLTQFFNGRPDRLRWAEELQAAFGRFFSNYRVLCQVHYVIDNRKEEIFN